MSRELLKQCLDLITELDKEGLILESGLIFALRDELAKPEQASTEPPDYVEPPTSDYHNGWEEGFEVAKNLFKKRSAPQSADPRLLQGGSDDCNAPQQLAKPEQEPVAWRCTSPPCRCYDASDAKHCAYGYTAPPRKPWQGLTDEDVDWILGLAYADDMELIKTIEAKLKEKNGG
jgi:hypothetical protein